MVYHFQVENIKCGGCANSVTRQVFKTHGVWDVDVDLMDGTVTIEGVEELDLRDIKSNLASIGYPETGQGNKIQKARSYVSCVMGRMSRAETI